MSSQVWIGGDVGVDQNARDALLAQGLDRLAAGVVELAGLADLGGRRAEDQDLLAAALRSEAHAASTRRMRGSSRPLPGSRRTGTPCRWAGAAPRGGTAREKKGSSVADALVRAVVDVREPGLQSSGSVVGVDGEAVVLGGDVAARRSRLTRLVVAAVAVLELVGVGAGGERHDLVAEADAEDRACRGSRPAYGGDRLGRSPSGRQARWR